MDRADFHKIEGRPVKKVCCPAKKSIYKIYLEVMCLPKMMNFLVDNIYKELYNMNINRKVIEKNMGAFNKKEESIVKKKVALFLAVL